MLRNLNKIAKLSLLKLYKTTNSTKHLLIHMLDGAGKKQNVSKLYYQIKEFIITIGLSFHKIEFLLCNNRNNLN